MSKALDVNIESLTAQMETAGMTVADLARVTQISQGSLWRAMCTCRMMPWMIDRIERLAGFDVRISSGPDEIRERSVSDLRELRRALRQAIRRLEAAEENLRGDLRAVDRLIEASTDGGADGERD